MGDEKQEGLAVQIATLTQQMRSVAASVEDIKRSVQPFADFDDSGREAVRYRRECRAALYFLRPPAKVEVINDINGELINLYRVVQHHLEEFVRQFKWARTSRQVFE